MKCPKHPKYKAVRRPTADCADCRAAFARRDDVGDKIAAHVAAISKDSTEVYELKQRLSRAEDDLRIARARAESAEKAAHEANRIRETVFGLTSVQPSPPEWVDEVSSAHGAPHVPVLVSSDKQWGEVIKADEMDGLNEFNIEIAQERLHLLYERTVDISVNHLPKNRYSGMIYLRLGDEVSGDIHEELRETNELSAIPAVRDLVENEEAGLMKLADTFERVHVVSVPGNHGRTQKKPPSKRVYANYDTLSAWWLEKIFQKDPRFTWQTPNSVDAVVDVHGRLLLATHGDRIGSRGGEGFVGPAATIVRGMKRVHDEYARRGSPLYKVLVGHFHTAYDLGLGYSNGCLPGYSEYARGGRMAPEPPLQWLLYFHPRYGVTSQWKILLAPEFEAAPRTRPFAA